MTTGTDTQTDQAQDQQGATQDAPPAAPVQEAPPDPPPPPEEAPPAAAPVNQASVPPVFEDTYSTGFKQTLASHREAAEIRRELREAETDAALLGVAMTEHRAALLVALKDAKQAAVEQRGRLGTYIDELDAEIEALEPPPPAL